MLQGAPWWGEDFARQANGVSTRAPESNASVTSISPANSVLFVRALNGMLQTAVTQLQKSKKGLTPSRELTISRVQSAEAALEKTSDIAKVKDIHDKLRLFELYFKHQGSDRIAANEIVYQRIRTLKKLGAMLPTVPKSEEERPADQGVPQKAVPTMEKAICPSSASMTLPLARPFAGRT